MKWTEFHFFKQPGGLSKNDALEMRICSDYEQALGCEKIVNFLCRLSAWDKEEIVSRTLRYRNRFAVLLGRLGKEEPGLSSPLFRNFKEMQSFPPVPAACVAASWFPKHWLSAPSRERRKLVHRLKSLYPILGRSIPIWEFPMESAEQELLRSATARDKHTTLHVIAIDRTQTRSALVQRFKMWIDEQKDISGTQSRKGKIKAPALLNDLGCYRLSKLDAISRETVMAEYGFRRSVGKLSAAKRRAERRLKSLNYI